MFLKLMELPWRCTMISVVCFSEDNFTIIKRTKGFAPFRNSVMCTLDRSIFLDHFLQCILRLFTCFSFRACFIYSLILYKCLSVSPLVCQFHRAEMLYCSLTCPSCLKQYLAHGRPSRSKWMNFIHV